MWVVQAGYDESLLFVWYCDKLVVVKTLGGVAFYATQLKILTASYFLEMGTLPQPTGL